MKPIEYNKNYTEKTTFFYKAFSKRREVPAHSFNPVLLDYWDRFYEGKPYENVLVSFKKWMTVACQNNGHIIEKLKATEIKDLKYNEKTIWLVRYNN